MSSPATRGRILLAGFLFLQASAQGAALVVQKEQRQLFFDDLLVERMDNVTRVVNQPTKHPKNPVLRREHPWEAFRVQVYGTIIHDPYENRFKAWYMNIPRTAAEKITVNGKRRPGHATLLSYATSPDGITWHKPVLNLVDFEGSTENNMIAPDMYNPEGFSVLYEPHDPDPDRRYKAFYWDHGYGPLIMHEGLEIYGSGPKDGMHVAFSTDGVHWKPYEKNPVMKHGSDTGQVVLYDEDLKRYVAFGRMGAGGRRVARTESADFIHWTQPKLVLDPDEKDGPNTQFYGISINRYAGMYIGVLWMFYIETKNIGRIDFQLCHSRDGKEWVRDPERRVFLGNGPAGEWDSGDMRGACRSVILPDRVLFYYAGSGAPHGLGGERRIGMDIGLATLRRDGWVSLDAGVDAGTVLTRPFVCPGGQLGVNADAGRGRLTVTVLNADGKTISGFESAQSTNVNALHLRPRFSKSLQTLAGKTIRLRLELRNATLYSYWFD